MMETVLSWLEPRDVAATALTSRAMAAASRCLTSLREADAAQGMERFAVPVENLVDECRYPYFEYSPVSILARADQENAAFSFPPGRDRRQSGDGFDFGRFEDDGCGCVDDCREDNEEELKEADEASLPKKRRRRPSSSCPCGQTVFGERAYAPNSSKLLEFSSSVSPPDDLPLIFECGPSCSCSIDCENRLSQRGLAVKLKVVRHPIKGWSLHAAQDIEAGCFICEYAGERLTTREAQRRHQTYDKCSNPSSLMVVREHLPSGEACLRFNIDATIVGNVARFINHSCDGGNLLTCLVRAAGCCVPKLVFFARREIKSGEELTFSYGVVEPGRESSSKPCFCGTGQCRGMLPSEAT